MSHPAPGPVRLPEKVMEVRGMQISAKWTASLARRLGLDANPLRRGTDRAEAWIRIALVLAFLVGAPLAGWGAGRWAGSVAGTAVEARLAGDHLVRATLLRGGPRARRAGAAAARRHGTRRPRPGASAAGRLDTSVVSGRAAVDPPPSLTCAPRSAHSARPSFPFRQLILPARPSGTSGHSAGDRSPCLPVTRAPASHSRPARSFR